MDLQNQADELAVSVADAVKRLGIEALEKKLQELQKQTADPELWTDQARAQDLMKRQADLDGRISIWRPAGTLWLTI